MTIWCSWIMFGSFFTCVQSLVLERQFRLILVIFSRFFAALGVFSHFPSSEMQKTMMGLSKEMQKAGIIEEMMNDTMDSVFDEEGLEEAADEEVENVLFELTKGQLGKAPVAKNQKLPQIVQPTDEITLDDDDIEARMAGLKN